ncbi:MAG: hypothetical protein ABSD78_10195 [Acidimicrobiales bacterium]|jgi:hypothetical protein
MPEAPKPDVVYAISTLAVKHNGFAIMLHRGEPWDADAEIVLARPDLFGGAATNAMGRASRLERATR